MALETASGAVAFLAARVLFGAVLAFMGLSHFLQTDAMTGYAEAKGLPAPRAGVLASRGLLVLGGLGIVAGVASVLWAGAVGTFLLVSAAVFHGFWTVEDPEQQQTEMTQFLKNTALAGDALALLAVGDAAWPYSLELTLLG